MPVESALPELVVAAAVVHGEALGAHGIAIGVIVLTSWRGCSRFRCRRSALRLTGTGLSSDVLVTDISLPKMSGIGRARRVLELFPGTWLILSSGYALGSGLEKLGPHVRSLPKPFELDAKDALLSEIRSQLLGREVSAADASGDQPDSCIARPSVNAANLTLPMHRE